MRSVRGIALGVVAVAGLLAGAAGAGPAAAAVAPGPGYLAESIPSPAVFVPGTVNTYKLTVVNTGSLASNGTPITVLDTVPAGMTITEVGGEAKRTASELSCTHEESTARCVDDEVLPAGEELFIYVNVRVPVGMSATVTNAVQVFGGGATTDVQSFKNTAGGPAGAGLTAFHFTLSGANGAPDTQAGDHPSAAASSFQFATIESPRNVNYPVQPVKDVVVDLPPGFVGDTQEATQCNERQLEPSEEELYKVGKEPSGYTKCPPSSAVGTVSLDIEGKIEFGGNSAFVPMPVVYNLVPEHGYPAEFGFNLGGKAILLYATAVATPHGYVLQVSAPGILNFIDIDALTLTFWGVPSEAFHDQLRGGSSGVQPVGFLTNPVDCAAGPLTATAMSDTWEDQGRWTAEGTPDLSDPAWKVISTTVYPQITGCNLLQFNPSLEVTPETTEADESSGVTVTIRVPQAPQLPPDLPTPEFKNVTVTLPSGVSISPSAGDGLQACAAEQIKLESRLPGTCPNGSVLGTVTASTPLLADPLHGQVFLAQPNCDPCTNADAADGNMFNIYLELEAEGVVIKQHGTIYANTTTGQLTTVFKEAPQFPVSELQVQFKGGLRASLATPQQCGEFASTADIVPWSTPITPDATPTSAFDVSYDGNGAQCPAVTPFAPTLSAGTSNANAGQFSPLTLTFNREDREQDLASIQVKTPPGLLGVLSGVPLCGEPQADLGTCSEASRIGSLTVAAGPGGHPFYEKGTIYLTGPYHGAPFGLSIVVPTVAGPFNLGNVVVRAKIEVDPDTTALTVTSDPLPQILDGIPLRLRTANVTIDRPGFIFNPTDCAQLHIEGTLTGAQGAVAHVAAPFAVSGCRGLGFAPKFEVYTQGHTSRVDGASLLVKLLYPKGASSNISHVKVELPKQLPARLTTLQKACPAQTFEANPAACPPASLVGITRATTPVLPVALTGPAYFVSHGGEAFPNLIVVLQGYGVRIDLVGDTFISKAGITSSTFANVPDVQVTSFELFLPEGPHSALAANGNLCRESMTLPGAFTAQDGAQLRERFPIQVIGCPRASISKRARDARRRTASKAARTATAHVLARRGRR
jgi:hypothetical protein